MSGHPSLVGASAGRGLRRLLAAALALGMALALAVPARAATEVFPANGGFDGSAAGWSSSESCDGLASALLCSVDSSYAGGDGAPPGSIEFSANTVLSVNQLNTIAQDLLGGVALDDLLEGLIDPGGLLGGLLGPGLIDLEDVVGGLGLPLQLDGAGLDQLLGGLGLPVVSEGGLNDLIGLLGIVVLPVEPRGTWASPEFTYSGASPQAVTFSYDRRALIGPLVNLGGKATVQVVLVNITNGTQTVLADEELTAANGSFTPSTRGVVPNAISPGSRYRIEIRTRFSSLVSVLATSKMQYDNVRLTVFDGSGGGGGGGGQGGTGAGGLGACTADLSRPAIATGRARGNPERVALSRQQLLINQRISQAGVRRVNTVIDKLTAGLTANDFRDCSVGPIDFDPALVQNIAQGAPAIPPTAAAAARPTPRRPSGGGDPSRVALSRQQLLINQRISQAAVRRVNAIRERLNGNITAGDIRSGALSALKLDTDARFTFNRALPAGGAASTAFRPLQLKNLGRGRPDKVTLSRQQLLINQRISQAAVRRINQVRAELRQGLTGVNVKDGSLARATLSPQVQSGS